MTAASTRTIDILRRHFGAREAEAFFGRGDELTLLKEAALQASEGIERLIAVTGPSGSGRRELLRQTAVATWSAESSALSVCIELDELTPAAIWPAVLSEVLRIALVRLGEPAGRRHDPQQLLSASLSELPARCAGLGAFGLINLAERMPRADALVVLPLMQALEQLELPRIVLFLLTAANELPAWAVPVLNAFRRAGIAVLMTAVLPVESRAASLELEGMPLAPLELADAQKLAASCGGKRKWRLDESVLEPILRRLGPWPGWVRAWCAQYRPPGAESNGVRAAAEAYQRLLKSSGWSSGLKQLFHQHLAEEFHPQLFEILRELTEAAGSDGSHAAKGFNPALLNAPFNLRAPEAGAFFRELLAAGLVTHTPSGLRGPRYEALADWLSLAAEPEDGNGLLTQRQLEMLARLLEAPRSHANAAEVEAAPSLPAQNIPQLLQGFRGQALPDVFFNFADYHEALGRLSPKQRRETIAQSAHLRQLPETIGVARIDGTHPFYATRGFAEGKYQRSHEHVWLVADFSAARLVTTPEVRQALELFEAAREEQGAGQYTRWLIIGDGASAEALELIQSEKLLCSCREQVLFLGEFLNASGLTGRKAAQLPSNGGSEFDATTPKNSGRHAIVDLHGPVPPGHELSRLSLPAREGSEYMAALFAEKLALRSEFSASDAGKIKTSVLEGVLNAIEHSLNQEKLVELDFFVSPEALEIFIENEGAEFDPLGAPPAPDPRVKLTSRNKRGWGINLMRQFMDEVDYEPCTRGTRLRLFKRRIAKPTVVPRFALGES